MDAKQVEIRRFRDENTAAFYELNVAWIEKFFVMEDADRAALGDPAGYILAKGGHIFMAFLGARPVGTCALIRTKPGEFEVAKMSVSEEVQGMGIGRRLLEHAVAEARVLGTARLSLETNSKLTPAIRLYESTGFRHLPQERVAPSPYVRANVFMEMVL
jgi:GNAT superfamily N-acetyltransferase